MNVRLAPNILDPKITVQHAASIKCLYSLRVVSKIVIRSDESIFYSCSSPVHGVVQYGAMFQFTNEIADDA